MILFYCICGMMPSCISSWFDNVKSLSISNYFVLHFVRNFKMASLMRLMFT